MGLRKTLISMRQRTRSSSGTQCKALLAIQGQEREGGTKVLFLACEKALHLSTSKHNPPRKVPLKGQENSHVMERRTVPFKHVTQVIQYKTLQAAQLYFICFFYFQLHLIQNYSCSRRREGRRRSWDEAFFWIFFSRLHLDERRSYVSSVT